MGEVNALLAEVKPWTQHSFYEDAFTRPWAIRLSELCERFTDAKLKLGGSSADPDRREMLRMTWQNYVSRLYTDDQGTLVPDETILEVLEQVEANTDKLESLSQPSKKLKRPLSIDQANRTESEIQASDIEEPTSVKRSRQDLAPSRSLPSVPVKIPSVKDSGVYYFHACTRML